MTEQISQVRQSFEGVRAISAQCYLGFLQRLPPLPELQCWRAKVVCALAIFLPEKAEFTMRQSGATL